MKKYINPRYKPDSKVSTFDSNLQTIRRLYIQAIGQKSLSTARRIRLEGYWTDVMLKLLSRGNSDVLKSFRYRLEMDENNNLEEMRQD
jgi:hypothetical protein